MWRGVPIFSYGFFFHVYLVAQSCSKSYAITTNEAINVHLRLSLLRTASVYILHQLLNTFLMVNFFPFRKTPTQSLEISFVIDLLFPCWGACALLLNCLLH